MTTVFVLINCVFGKEAKIIENMTQMNSVTNVHGTSGAYDLIATIEDDNKDKIQKMINQDIRNIDDVCSTLTLIRTNEQDSNFSLTS